MLANRLSHDLLAYAADLGNNPSVLLGLYHRTAVFALCRLCKVDRSTAVRALSGNSLLAHSGRLSARRARQRVLVSHERFGILETADDIASAIVYCEVCDTGADFHDQRRR